MSEEPQASDTQANAQANAQEAEAEAAHMRWAEANAEPRGQLHVPDGQWERAHYDNVPRARHEPSQRARKMSRTEYNSYRNRQQTLHAMNRPPSPDRIPMEPYSGGEDMVQRDWFARLYRFLFGAWPY